MDFKAQGNLKSTRSYIGLYPKGEKLKPASNRELDSAIEQELTLGKEKQQATEPSDQLLTVRLRSQIFRNKLEQLLEASLEHRKLE